VKVLVTGSRKWTNCDLIRAELKAWAAIDPQLIVVHGACRGADAIAGSIAKELGLTVREYPGDWLRYGLAAGPIRNSELLKAEHTDCDVKIDLCLAFGDGPGTRDMTRKAFSKGIRIVEIHEV
jgi:hypothetical protein